MFEQPWKYPSDKPLFKSVFAQDAKVAKSSAVTWFENVNIEDIEYCHHRLIAALGHRFGNDAALSPYSKTIQNVSKQLWIRGTRTIRSLDKITKHMSNMRVPWGVLGNVVWHGRDKIKFRDCEQIEIMVEQNAFTHVFLYLWQHGWQPPKGTDLYDPNGSVFLTGPNEEKMVLWSDEPLKNAYPKITNQMIWANVAPRNIYQMALNSLSDENLLRVSLGRSMQDIQWLVDLTEIQNVDPSAFLSLRHELPWWNRKVRIFESLQN